MRSLASSNSVVHSVMERGVSDKDGACGESSGGSQEGETSKCLQQRKHH